MNTHAEAIRETLLIALDVESLEPDQTLVELDCWDSLGVLSVQAALDSEYAVTLGPQDFEEVITVGDLIDKTLAQMQKKQEGNR